MCNKPDPSAPIQLDTSLTTKQLIDIRAEAMKIIEATNKAIALGYFSGNLIDKFGDIQKCQDEEFMNVHNSVDAILDSLGVPLVGDDMPVLVAEKLSDSDMDVFKKKWESVGIDKPFTPFVSIEDGPIETTKDLKLNHSILHCPNIT